MSIIQQLREKYAAWGIAAIVVSLIAFIATDAFQRSGSGSQVNNSDAVAEVNGTKISNQELLVKTDQQKKMYEAQGRRLDDQANQQVSADVFRSLIEGTLVNQEIEKLGLTVTDKEFNDMLFGANPPADLKQAFTDPATGQYNAAMAKQQIGQMKKQKGEQRQQIEDYFASLIENKKRQKYIGMIQNSSYVPKWMAEKTIADNNSIASLSFVTVPYASIADSTVKVSDEQINEYVQQHKNEFKLEEAVRSIAYVSFDVLPSASDSAEVLNDVSSQKAEFATTTDPAAFVTRSGSTLPFYDGYNSRERIQIPQKDSIIGAGVGTVYGPYLDGSNYVISRVVDMKVLPDSAKVRHILISLNDEKGQPIMDDSTAKKRADSIKTAIDGGADFAALVTQYSTDQGSKEKGGVYDFFPQGQMVPEFNDFAFQQPKGKTGVVKTQFGYHIIEVLDQKNPNPAYKIAYVSKPIIASSQTISAAVSKANIFYGEARKDLKAFDDAVKKNNYNKLVATEIHENDFQVQGIGVERNLVRSIYEKKPGEVLEPEEVNNRYVVVAITGAEEKGLPSAAKVRPMVENIVRNQLKAKQIIAKLGTPSSLEAVATANGTTVQRADSIMFASPMLPNVGMELKVGGAAFNKANLNKVSAPIAGNSGVFVIKVDAIGAKPDPSTTVDQVRKQIESQLKQSSVYTSISALRSAAKVTDNRSKFM